MTITERTQQSILYLPEYVEQLPPQKRRIFDGIFNVSRAKAPLVFGDRLSHLELAKSFGTSPENMRERIGIRVANIVLDEETLFNPVRSNRPMIKSETDITSLADKNPAHKCVFCDYHHKTPEEQFGRIEGQYSVSAANAGAYDAWHGLIFPKNVHNPADLDKDILKDMLDVANRWFKKVNEEHPEARFPLIGLNILPRSGASIFHPHLQTLLAVDRPYQKVEDVRRRTADYRVWNNDRPYLSDFAEATEDLGLVFRENSATTVFNLTPRKEREVVIFTNDQAGIPNGDLSEAAFRVIKWWSEYGVTSYNMIIFMPPLGADLRFGEWAHFYPYARLVDRGKEGNATNDMGVMETYMSPVVAADPLQIAKSYADFQQDMQKKERLARERSELNFHFSLRPSPRKNRHH